MLLKIIVGQYVISMPLEIIINQIRLEVKNKYHVFRQILLVNLILSDVLW